MRMPIKPLLLLSSALAFAPACDEAFDEGLDAAFVDDEEGPVASRCVGANCPPIGGMSNTSKIGDHALTNAAKDFKTAAANLSADNTFVDGSFYFGPHKYPIERIEVRPDGELRLWNSTFFVGGEDVKNARLNIKVTPHDPAEKAFVGELVIADARCELGAYFPSMRICVYDFVTDVKPADEKSYDQHYKMWGYYHTCPNENEGGSLKDWEMYGSVLSNGAVLTESYGGTPSIGFNKNQFIIGCINGAVSKTQYKLNAFYDPTAFRGLNESQATPALLGWMAWFDGRTRTIPGMWVSFDDPIQGLFKFTADPAYRLEAGYGSTGAVCRGTTHRHVVDPMVKLPGWSALPSCSSSEYSQFAPIGVMAIPAI